MFKQALFQPVLLNALRGYRRNVDPGIGNRKVVLKKVDRDIDLEDTDFDDWESDFMDVHVSHKNHVKEQHMQKEILKYQIVKQKYFRQKYPNFLTWNDKQQIKYLYNTNSEEWTIEKLSDSFPALPEVIEKVVKSKYSKKESQIKNHDVSVQKNWMAFKKGEMTNFPVQLTEHLKKFSDRSLNYNVFVKPEKIEAVQGVHIPTEFADIITSYEELKKQNKKKTENPGIHTDNHTQQNLGILNEELKKEQMPKVVEKNVTLQQLRSDIESGVLSGKEIPIQDKLILDTVKVKEKNSVVQLGTDEIKSVMEKNKYQSASGLRKKTEKDYSHLNYPEEIRIPKNKLKYGYTYKLNDCYYDSDGMFLYRVPGMG